MDWLGFVIFLAGYLWGNRNYPKLRATFEAERERRIRNGWQSGKAEW